MTNEQIEKIIRLMGFTAMDPYKFARAVERAAYEAAAQLCEKHADDYAGDSHTAAELRATAFAIRLEAQEQPK